MGYIVLDFEWNSAYYKPQGRFINEIIQIGAVKLGDNLEVVDTFQIYVKSKIVKKLSSRTISLTGITNEQMNSGVGFRDAVTKYNEWAGKGNITMTWSDSDLYAIVENSRIFLDNSLRFFLDGYLDLQSYIQGELRLLGNSITNQISLSNAAEMLNISTDGFELHNAKDDAHLCAIMLRRTFNKERFDKFIRDTSDKSFYDRLFFRAYYISNINDKRIDKKTLKFMCPNCKKALKGKNMWRFKNNWFRSEKICEKCNVKYRTMVSFKQTFDNIVVKRRILPMIKAYEEQNATV